MARFDYDLFGLARSPVSGTMRSLYVGGRVNWSWQFAHDWHLSASDSAKLQRQPSLPVAAFQRNEATVGLDWHPVHAPASWSLEFSDRRRALPSLEILEFHRRSLTLTASASRESARWITFTHNSTASAISASDSESLLKPAIMCTRCGKKAINAATLPAIHG